MLGSSAIIWALFFAIVGGGLNAIREKSDESVSAAVGCAIATFVVLLFFDFMFFHFARPMTTLIGLTPLFFVNIVITAAISGISDAAGGGMSLGTVLGIAAILGFGIFWFVSYNSGHNAYKASHIVSVTIENATRPPASSTSHLVVVSSTIATTKAEQTMTVGEAAARNFSTYLTLGPATLQFVSGHMWYVFPLEFDGSGNKKRLHAIEPGYIMVSAEDPNASPVEHYDGKYSMIVSLGGGQGSEPLRWAYDHGYSSYLLDDATLEINTQGDPYYTVTLVRPQLGWTFDAPVGVLLINAHTGQITKYSLHDVPNWVDRVYSEQMAETIVNWYGMYAHAGFKGLFGLGSTNANRFKLSGAPVLVYTGSGHPEWRMLLTSFNSDNSVAKIVLMNSHSGALQIYTPEGPMSVETPVYQAFDNASGTGATLIKANHYNAVDLTLHVIYGHLTWMAVYQTSTTNPSFVGLGFVDAYHTQANNVAFGNSKSAALQNYLSQLASEATANGNNPGQGGEIKTISGTIAPNGVNWDVTGGQKYWYISLSNDPSQVFVGTVSSLGTPSIVLAQPGDHVVISYLKVTQGGTTLTMKSFTDKEHQLSAAGT